MNIIDNLFTFIILSLTSFAQSFIKPDTILIESNPITELDNKLVKDFADIIFILVVTDINPIDILKYGIRFEIVYRIYLTKSLY